MSFDNGGGFTNGILGAEGTLIRAQITSANWSGTVTPTPNSWAILKNGDAYFFNGTFSGSLTVTGTGSQTIIADVNGSGQPTLAFNSGSGEALPAEIFASPGSPPTFGIQSAKESNGTVNLDLAPSENTSAIPALANFFTSGETAPTGYNGVKAFHNIGGADASDVWQTIIVNTNGVATGHQALILGDNITPGNILQVSTNELLALNGSAVPQPFHLNENAAATAWAGVTNKSLRQQSTTVTGSVTPGAGGYTSFISITGVPCPASGVGTVTLRFLVTPGASMTTNSFVAGCPNIANTTQSTTPFAATDNRCAQVDGSWLTSSGLITVSTTVTATALGNPGDLLTISGQFHQQATTGFTVSRIELVWLPSL